MQRNERVKPTLEAGHIRYWGLILIIGAGLLVALTLGIRDIRRAQSELGQPLGSGSATGIPTIRFVENPSPVPEFTYEDLEGRSQSTSDWLGKVVLLNFWATWCPPCRAEIPDLIRLQTEYADRLLIVGLSMDAEGKETVQSFVDEAGINYMVGMSSPEVETKFGGILGLPTTFLVDTRGRVVQKHIGFANPELYEMEIRALLDLPVNANVETFEDTGQIFLANAANATELPGVDLSQLNPEQRTAALRQLNEQKCTCGCDLTLAQCRINDTTCDVSLGLAKQVVEKILSGE